MKSELGSALASEDFGALAHALDDLADLPVQGFPHWEEFARGAARAAERGDLAAVRTACAECHRAYRATYRLQRRTP